MPTVIGIWIALAGVLPVIVGLAAMRRVARLRQGGVNTWALTVPPRLGNGTGGTGGGRYVGLQYTLADGRVLEKLVPARGGKIGTLRPGQQILIWYDPADPMDILVYGRPGRVSDTAFVLAGLALMAGGAVLAILAP